MPVQKRRPDIGTYEASVERGDADADRLPRAPVVLFTVAGWVLWIATSGAR